MYIIAGCTVAASRLPRFADSARILFAVGAAAAVGGLLWHLRTLGQLVLVGDGLQLSLANSASFVGAQLSLIALAGMLEPRLRGLAGGLLLLAALAAAATGAPPPGTQVASGWPLQAHILVSLFAYGLLAVGAIVALAGLVQERRLRAGRLTSINHLFAPLETTESLLFGIAAAGFATLVLGVLSGLLFVDDLFAQHLVHKTVLSLVALLLFGVLLAGRQFAGWRGRTAVKLYLWGFGVLCLAYFGSRYILENLLGRTWG